MQLLSRIVQGAKGQPGICRASFRNVIHFEDAAKFTAQHFRPILSVMFSRQS